MSRARELAKLGNINVLSADISNSEVGIATTVPRSTLDVRGEIKVGTGIQAGTSGVLTATSFDGGLSGNIVASACTFTTGNFTGNVTIGGTLTYEDVTNVDALGIITARAGVNVSGGELLVGSNILASGTAGVLTATSFVGSGAQLTGITQTTINNNADNRLITGSGTANTLNGESNLTFDGASFKVGSGITVAATAGVVTFANGSTTANNITLGNGKLRLYHNGSNAGYISMDTAEAGTLNIRGTGGNNGNIQIYNNYIAMASGGNQKLLVQSQGVDIQNGYFKSGVTTATSLTVTGTSGLTASGGEFKVGLGVTIASTSGVATFSQDTLFIGAGGKNAQWDASSGAFDIYDNTKINFGNSDDLSIYHDGSNSFVDNTGELRIRGTYVKIRGANDEDGLIFTQNGSIQLKYNNNLKLETTTNGTVTTGISTADGFSVGNGEFYRGFNNSGASKIVGGYSSGSNTLRLGESVYLDSNGQLGVSNSSPATVLDIKSNKNSDGLTVTKSSNIAAFLGHNGSGDEGLLLLKDGGTTTVQIIGETGQTSYINSGDLLVGTSTSRTINSHTPKLQITGYDYGDSTVSIINNENNANGSYLFFGKQRSGGPGGSTAVAADDIVGELRFNAGDGTDLDSLAARIIASVDGTPGSNDTPGRLQFYTTADGSASSTERLRIGSAGQLGIAGANYGSSGQVLTSQGASSAPQWATPSGAVEVVAQWNFGSDYGQNYFNHTGLDNTTHIRYVLEIAQLQFIGNASKKMALRIYDKDGSLKSGSHYKYSTQKRSFVTNSTTNEQGNSQSYWMWLGNANNDRDHFDGTISWHNRPSFANGLASPIMRGEFYQNAWYSFSEIMKYGESGMETNYIGGFYIYNVTDSTNLCRGKATLFGYKY